MYCPKCQKEDNSGKHFCRDCGSRLLDDENKESNIIIEKSSGSKVLDNSSMVEEFVGGSYEKIRGIGFSLPFLVFGPYYSLYRKMYLFSIIYILVTFLILYFIPGLIILPGIVQIVLSFSFNNIYLSWVSNKVNQIKRSSNSDDRATVLKLCRQFGGVNMLPCVLAYMIVGFLSYKYLFDKYKVMLSKYGINTTSEKSSYNELQYKNPDGMQLQTSESGSKIYVYYGSKDSCEYTVDIFDATLSARNYLHNKKIYTGKDIKQEIKEISINNNNWELLEVKTTSGATVYDYAANYNHKTYNVVYKIYKDSKICMANKDKLINSLYFN